MASQTSTFRIEGLSDLLRATDNAGKDVKKFVRDGLRKAAVPIRDEARARLTPTDVRSAAKIGISVRKVGTVTVEQRLNKSSDVAGRRANYASWQMRHAFLPALDSKGDEAVRMIEEHMDRILRDWGS